MKALTLSYDDGVEQDIRLLDIMNRHGLKGTFNLNAGLYAPEGTVWPAGQIHRRLTRRAARDLYAASGQEIALHAFWHGDLPALPPAHAIWQVMRDKEALEEDFGRIVRGMAYPYGTAVTTWRISFARTSTTAQTPGMATTVSSSAAMYPP